MDIKQTKHERNLEALGRRHAFGGLIAYRVSCFDPVRFKLVDVPMTFNADHAKARMEEHRPRAARDVVAMRVHFDGAFAVHTEKE